MPRKFQMDEEDMQAFLKQYTFGTLICQTSSEPSSDWMGTHIPFLYDVEKGQLLAHMAKSNPQWQSVDGQSVMVVFQGPHTYISPSWYGIEQQVPTWNYAAVHVYGQCRLVEDAEILADVLARTIRHFEPASVLPEDAEQGYYQNMMKAIIGFRIDITRMEGAVKLSQNKTSEVQRRVISRLRNSPDAMDRAVSGMMEKHLNLPAMKSELVVRKLSKGEALPMDLLLLADPSTHHILTYASHATCMVAEWNGDVVGVYVLLERSANVIELINIAVREDMQNNGIGKHLVLHAIGTAREGGAESIEVGTGNSSLHQLALYQACGFRMTDVDVDFFVRNYPDPIYENGMQCRDMVRLRLDLTQQAR